MNEVVPPNLTARQILALPFFVLMAVTLVLTLAAAVAWGVADDFGYASWIPTAGALLFAGPVFIGAVWFARAVWQRTSHPFRLQKIRFVLGLACVAAIIGLTVAYVFVVNDPESYRSNEIDPVTHEYKPNLTPESFLSFSFLIAVFFPCGALALAAKVLYLGAINPIGLRRPAGVDAIGEIMSSQSQEMS